MNQHYVPRCYLKNFAEQRGKQFYTYVFDKVADRQFQTNIKNICSEIDLYTLDQDNQISDDLLIIERLYSDGIEPTFLKAYDILVNNDVFFVTDLQRVEILIGILQFYIRNPSFLNRGMAAHKSNVNQLFHKAKNEGAKGISYLDEDFSFKEWDLDMILKYFTDRITREFKEKHISILSEIGTFHENAKFEICVIKDDSEFMTSDNPLIMNDPINMDFDLIQKSKEFIIPLNRKIALKLYHDNSKNRNEIYRCYIPNGSVASINETIVEQASRFVICKPELLLKHSKIKNDFLANTSLKLKMDAVKQILDKFQIDEQNKDMHGVLRYYFNKYNSQNGLTDKEQFEMFQKVSELNIDFIKRRTT